MTVPGSLVAAAHEQCAALTYPGPDNCSPVEDAGNGEVLVASAAASYHPAFYWLIGTAARPFDGTQSLYAMRIATSLLCLLFVAGAVWSLLRVPGRWPMASLVLAMSPVFVYSTTVAAPNGPEMSAAVCLWAALIAIVHGQRRTDRTRLLWIAIVAGVTLSTVRVLGPVFVLLIVATIVALRPRETLAVARRHSRTVAVGVLLTSASAIGQMLWMYQAVEAAVTSDEAEGPRSFDVSDLMLWPLQSIAAFPLRNEAGATVVYPIFLALVGAVLLLAVRFGSRRLRWVILGSLIVSLLVPLAFTFLTLGTIGSIWQGRYGLPYAVGFILLSGYALGQRWTGQLPAKAVAPAAALYGVGVAACLVKVRNQEVSGNAASYNDPAWHAPSVALLVLLAGAAALVFCALLSSTRMEDLLEERHGSREPGPRPERSATG